ncbi:MAG: macro domain-containing protein [Holophaga sp.]|nr:macro domain-containing protein [Holophaga sp.]
MTNRFRLQLGDITSMAVDAVVNSTDQTMLAGGPVHAAIHRAAGPELARECEDLGECPVGEARITGGHDLAAPFILHTVAPIWVGGTAGEKEALASCYLSCLRLAEAQGFESLAFPSIGSGTQPQFPLELAAPLAIRTILDWLDRHLLPRVVVLVCYDAATYQIHQQSLKEALP